MFKGKTILAYVTDKNYNFTSQTSRLSKEDWPDALLQIKNLSDLTVVSMFPVTFTGFFKI